MEFKKKFRIVCFALCLLVSSIAIIVEVNFDTNKSSTNSNTSNYIQRFCFSFYDPPFVLEDLNLLVTPMSIFLAFFFIVLNSLQNVDKLKSDLKKLKFSFIKSPMLHSVFRKKNRFHYALIFALTSFQVLFESLNIDNATQFEEKNDNLWDLSKFLLIFKEIFQVFASAFKFYPLFVAISSRIKIIRIFGGFYVIYKLISDKIEYIACNDNSIIKIFIFLVENKKFQDFLTFSYFIPQYAISSYLSIYLIFGSFLFTKKIESRFLLSSKLNGLVKLSYQVDDLFYTSNELVYCRNIFQQGSKNEILYNLPPNKSVTIYSLLWLIKNKLKFFARYFFDYKSSFKYSLRFLCTQFACFFCNYYLIVFIINVSMIVLEQSTPIIETLTKYSISEENSTCNFNSSFNHSKNCTHSEHNQNSILLYFSPYVANEPNINLKEALPFIFLIPLLATISVFLYQFMKGIREYKADFMEMCKGKSRYQSIYDEASNFEISIESFKYSGFYVGKINLLI